MQVPLHIKPDDYSREACQERYALHEAMMRLNPKGWPLRQDRLQFIASVAFDLPQTGEPPKKKRTDLEPTLNRLMRGRAVPAKKKIRKQARAA